MCKIMQISEVSPSQMKGATSPTAMNKTRGLDLAALNASQGPTTN